VKPKRRGRRRVSLRLAADGVRHISSEEFLAK
jgi:hypothetical protein